MSSKTKIVVLHMKEIIYTAIFAVLVIILALLLLFMFSPEKKKISSTNPHRKRFRKNLRQKKQEKIIPTQ